MKQQIVLGGGVTGLAAGMAGGGEVYEAVESPGGICSSYYMKPGSQTRLHQAPGDGEAYRFELGGGHWIFGGDPAVLAFIDDVAATSSYARKSSVYLPDRRLYAPFPIQNHLAALGADVADNALAEMSAPSGEQVTMKAWLRRNFGPTLFDLFFHGFNQLYTAGLFDRIAPQDAYKSPVDLKLVAAGVAGGAPAVGYNTRYRYPDQGLNALATRMAARCTMHYGKRAVNIDTAAGDVYFADGTSVSYSRLISTLPLDRMLSLTGLTTKNKPDPYTSVLVVNIGAKKGARCPDDHWVYVPQSKSGFHRVGFYSNVSPGFLPRSVRDHQDHVSIYVERAYPGGARPSETEVQLYCSALLGELREWGYIGDAEVVDPTWIDAAYTWSWPGSNWRSEAIELLQSHRIYQVGRYARWVFQGIADSIRDGFIVGSSLKEHRSA